MRKELLSMAIQSARSARKVSDDYIENKVEDEAAKRGGPAGMADNEGLHFPIHQLVERYVA